MKKMQIFEPAMCCSTGLCGVGVDSELLRVSTVLNNLKNNDIIVDRFNLTSAPQEFVINKEVNNFVKETGVEGLPIVVMDGEIVISRRYPTNEEFIRLLNVPKSYLGEEGQKVVKAASNEGCGCSGGDCCC